MTACDKAMPRRPCRNAKVVYVLVRHGPSHPANSLSERTALPFSTPLNHSTNSGHGTMVDFTVFIAIASATARPIPSSENG